MGGRKKKQPSFYQLLDIGLPRKQFLIQVNLILKFEAKVCKCSVKLRKVKFMKEMSVHDRLNTTWKLRIALPYKNHHNY